MKRSRNALGGENGGENNNNSRPHPVPPQVPNRLVYVEFYAGVGGWTYALEESLRRMFCDEAQCKAPSLECAAALDHSDLCLAVYHHNHGNPPTPAVPCPPGEETTSNASQSSKPKKPKQFTKNEAAAAVRIEQLTLQQLIGFKADIFLMSPPCQPHTRQHDNQEADLQDPRSRSFLHLCDLLEQLPKTALPKAVLLENVVGFESSNSCERWRGVLSTRNYRVGHFHLQPTQVGLPNNRPRYFTVAIHGADSEDAATEVSSLDSFLQREEFVLTSTGCETSRTRLNELILHTDLRALAITPIDSNEDALPSIQELLNINGSSLDREAKQALRIPDKILESNAAWCLDLVTPMDSRSSCFTSRYGKYCRGTGSVLYTGDKPIELSRPEDREFDPNWADGIDLKNDSRYFSGLEMARFFGFPSSFSFPDSVTMKQQWKLMGNSLNARVAGRLVELALRTLWKLPPKT